MSGFRKPQTIKRFADGAWVNGYWQGDTPTEIAITASVQPATDIVRKNLPEGFDIDSVFTIFTDTELRAAKAGSQQSDTIELFGETYQIVAVQRWQNDVIPHYQCTAARPKPQGA